jgi:hypothetical protein
VARTTRLPGDVAIAGFLQSVAPEDNSWAEAITTSAKTPWNFILLAITILLSWLIAGWRAANAEPLARAMESLVLMYRNHAAREDIIVFPAWKKTLPEKELDEMGEKFEEIEHQQFGEDGFDNAVKQIGEIEGMPGLTDISQFTAPPPPKA